MVAPRRSVTQVPSPMVRSTWPAGTRRVAFASDEVATGLFSTPSAHLSENGLHVQPGSASSARTRSRSRPPGDLRWVRCRAVQSPRRNPFSTWPTGTTRVAIAVNEREQCCHAPPIGWRLHPKTIRKVRRVRPLARHRVGQPGSGDAGGLPNSRAGSHSLHAAGARARALLGQRMLAEQPSMTHVQVADAPHPTSNPAELPTRLSERN